MNENFFAWILEGPTCKMLALEFQGLNPSFAFPQPRDPATADCSADMPFLFS
jgi:hypothetical protein